jgi:hypothetical protein
MRVYPRIPKTWVWARFRPIALWLLQWVDALSLSNSFRSAAGWLAGDGDISSPHCIVAYMHHRGVCSGVVVLGHTAWTLDGRRREGIARKFVYRVSQTTYCYSRPVLPTVSFMTPSPLQQHPVARVSASTALDTTAHPHQDGS